MAALAPSPAPLQIQCFGPFAVRAHGRPLASLRTRKGEWLLALLVLRAGHKIEREWLAGTLWPDSGEQNALANLRNSLKDLRRVLGLEAWRVSAPTTRSLSLDLAGATVDVLAFDAAIARGDPASLEQAVALYRGPLLEGCTEEWAFQERQVRDQAYLTALETLAVGARAVGDLATAEGYLCRVLARDPLREGAQRALMQTLAAGGNYAAAMTAFRELRLRLHRELNLAPDPETQALFQQLRAEARGKATGDRSGATPGGNRGDTPIHSLEPLALADDARCPHNLPLQLTRFIGREEQMAEVAQWLTEHRLVTLTGAGGCGKTRLALQVAAGLVEVYGDGVWLVALAALSDPGLVPQAVAVALGVREQPGRPLTAMLADHLRARSLLLVLDNCEHLLPACAGLAETLLQSCAHLRLLATSREGLRIAGEATYQVPPLSLPPAEGVGSRVSGVGSEPVPDTLLPTPDTLLQSEAGQLFVERAIAALPSFALHDQNATAVARVCHRLDGMPLAIELAAAWVKALPVEQINERLDDRFHLLTGGSRTALPRQQTLRATIDWSYDLLSEPERALLRRLSVFAGGWTLAAAEAVCGGDGIKERDVLDRLAGLVEKSLVDYEERETETRYRLLETIRQYAREKLVDAGESERVSQHHFRFYLSLAEEADRHLLGAGQAAWVERLETEHDNLRTALNWCKAESGSSEGLPGLVVAIWHFWLIRSHLVEGAEWLDTALERGQSAPAAFRARLLNGRAWIAAFQGDYLKVATLSEESLPLARVARDTRQIAIALVLLGRAAAQNDDLECATSLSEEARALALVEADRWSLLLATLELSYCRFCQGDYQQAAALAQEGMAGSREIGERIGGANCLLMLGKTALKLGDCARARDSLREALVTFEGLGDRWGIASCVGDLALVAEAEREPMRAATLLGAAMGVQEAFGVHMRRFEAQDYDRSVAAVRAVLGEKTFTAAWAEGRAMPLEEAVIYTLEGSDA